jgi:AcrR family transcriptional regulator
MAGRPKDQAARRGQLIQATLETIAEHGLPGTTMKNIAEAAGISPRLVPYYYPDLDSLVEAAPAAATERYYWSRRDVVAADANPPQKLAWLMYTGLPRAGDTLLSQALNELSVSAGRRAEHAALMTRLFDGEVSLYASVLEEGRSTGEFRLTEAPELIARNFVSLEDALGLHLLGRNASLDLAQAEQQLASFARSSTGVDVVAVPPPR